MRAAQKRMRVRISKRKRMCLRTTLGMAILVFALWIITIPFYVGFTFSTRGHALAIGGGYLQYTWGPPAAQGYDERPGLHIDRRNDPHWKEFYSGIFTLRLSNINQQLEVHLSFVFLFALSLCPIVILGGSQHRSVDRCSYCNYDLRGLANTICPECGQKHVCDPK